jgi:FlaA1/EpsC-like NDP-sugar epimerase
MMRLERSIHVGLTGWRRYAFVLVLDAACVCVAFYLGYFFRFEGRIPAPSLEQLREYLPLLLAIRIPLILLFGVHRWSFRFSGFYEAIRVVLACFTGTACFAMVFYFMQKSAEDVTLGPPRSVLLIEFFITTSLMGALRFSPRLAHTWFLGAVRARVGASVRTVIVGAGSAGDLLLRDLQRSDEHHYEIVGFVDDDASKWGTSIGGRPVLGPLARLPDFTRQHRLRELLFAIPRLPPPRLREVLTSCADLKLNYKILPVSFAYLSDRASGTMLQQLAPEDLLARSEVRFDPEQMRALINGRRILVTGAGGSIGSEICRQAATYAPASLILADMNENELYFLYRRLRREHPGLPVMAEVADIRDAARMRQLAERWRPQDVFHAAAHKHVPLMEYTPEEAVKNNVVGCRNVTEMARSAGVERFVLVSTDKAVNPASIMGATKKIAELLVAREAHRGSRGFTAVRFGNVLGSAGSVVPLFKAQIAAGGPVTVTHPECRRYLMTIPEAVGLVLAAGLGGYGELCILAMGEPIRILDLARLMITLSGLIPDQDVAIAFTGLRPGEKLNEQLMTAEEERNSRWLDDRVRIVQNPPPPPDLMDRIERLEVLAARGDRDGLRRAVRELVPSFVDSSASDDLETVPAPPPTRH